MKTSITSLTSIVIRIYKYHGPEIDILVLCETTFDAFDGDGDGVPDVNDAFPNDPDETKDTDGDGVGDNADLAPSVANDIIYSAGAILAIGLLAMLVLVI